MPERSDARWISRLTVRESRVWKLSRACFQTRVPYAGPAADEAHVQPFSYFIFSCIRFQSLDFGGEHLDIVFQTSRDHLLISDSPRLSVDISGIRSRKTAVLGPGRDVVEAAFKVDAHDRESRHRRRARQRRWHMQRVSLVASLANPGNDTGISEKHRSFHASLCLAMQRCKLIPSALFGALRARFPTRLLLKRSAFVHRRRYHKCRHLRTAVVLFKIPEMSIESLCKS